MSQSPNEIEALNRDATKWTLIAVASLVLGVALFVGPFAWVKSREVRAKLAALGQPDHGGARLAVLISGAVSVLSLLGVLAILAVLVGIRTSSTY